MTAFDGASPLLPVYFDGVHPAPGLIGIGWPDDMEESEQAITVEQAEQIATDLLDAIALRKLDRPNHFAHDSLGDPAKCTEDHNHPDPEDI